MSSPDPAQHSRQTSAQSAQARSANERLSALVVVPTYNGGSVWREAAQRLACARKASHCSIRIKVVDSSSRDDSANIARQHGFEVSTIRPEDFDHGGTRNAVVRGEPGDIYVFLTQDAILEHPLALDMLLNVFDDPSVAVAYGRQLPHRGANPIAVHARGFNYGAESRVVGLEDKGRLGIKTVFTSNSFAAYRADTFSALGGFPERNILSEDMYLAARAVLTGSKVAYVAQACVRHSHDYSPLEEFRRYFDIGVFQRKESWIGDTFGAAEGEGMRFVKAEFNYLLAHAPLWMPRACLHNALKIAGYRIGKNYQKLPLVLRRTLSMHPRYWEGTE